MILTYITSNPMEAQIAHAAGVDRIMVDLEINGKELRQGHLNTVISRHTLDDVKVVRTALPSGHLMVRINPMDVGSASEIENVLVAGADQVMLPMFTSHDEVAEFIKLLDGRARPVLLLETPQALARLAHILDLPGDFEVHVGLNDLHLALGLDFMFEVLSGGLLEGVSQACARRGVLFGFGGVGRIGGMGLISAESILGEHSRLGSNQVILSRDFRILFENPRTAEKEFTNAVRQVRQVAAEQNTRTEEEIEMNKRTLKQMTENVARTIAKAKKKATNR